MKIPDKNKVCVYTLNIGDWLPELTAVTIPYIEMYAKKIGADFKIITERKFPEFPPNYEKVQIYEIGDCSHG